MIEFKLDHLKGKPPLDNTRKRVVDSNPIPIRTGALAFTAVAVTGAMMGTAIATYVFFGTVMLTGLIVLVENNPVLKRVAVRSNSLIDIGIFTASVIATASAGITVSAALTVAGLGYTLIYSPYLRSQYKFGKPLN